MNPTEIELKQTCGACPEQYDAICKGRVVGYLRLRWGCFTVQCPDVSGGVVYQQVYGDELLGTFPEAEREAELLTARIVIAGWWNGQALHGPEERLVNLQRAVTQIVNELRFAREKAPSEEAFVFVCLRLNEVADELEAAVQVSQAGT